MSDVNWYVLRAVAGQEKKVKEYLEADIARQGLQEFVPQILIPTETVQEMRNGKKIKEKKLFFLVISLFLLTFLTVRLYTLSKVFLA